MEFKTRPYEHQLDCLRHMDFKPGFAVLMEQGLGKTKVVIDEAAEMSRRGLVDGMLIIAPNGVHANWIRREIPTHCPEDINPGCLEWNGGRSKKFEKSWDSLLKHHGLSIFSMNVEAFSSSKRAIEFAHEFLKKRRCVVIIDESTRIKNPTSNRTKAILRLGRLSKFKRIMTGTPVTQSPFDLYSQFQFLDPDILGFSSYFSFKHYYGVWMKERAQRGDRSWEYEMLLQYVHLDDLQRKIEPFSYRRTKAECLDLPEKIYVRIPIELTDEQRRMYNQMEAEGSLEFDDFSMLAPLKITRLLRCQQLIGGFLPTWDPMNEVPVPLPGGNPKLTRLMECVQEDYVGKSVIWARFRHEIRIICDALREAFGRESVVEYHGSVSKEDRIKAIDRFQNDPKTRFLVGQQSSGIGFTVTATEYMFYYSNTFSYDERYQTEDRAHRIGLRHPVVYIDLEGMDTVDERIRDVLANAKSVADVITGDAKRNGLH